jgi:hypothetical protein
MARLAVSRAISRLERGSNGAQAAADTRDSIVPPALVVRGTTGPARSGVPTARSAKH